MHSDTRRSSFAAIVIALTAAVLVACGGSQGSVPASVSGSPAGRGVAVPPAAKIGGEILIPAGGTFTVECGKMKVKGGEALGAYAGTFNATVSFRHHGDDLRAFKESFTITSGSNTIAGQFIWDLRRVRAFCQKIGLRYPTIDPSRHFSYTATLYQGSRAIEKFSGRASENGLGNIDGDLEFNETLK